MHEVGGGGDSTHPALLTRGELQGFRCTDFPPLSDYYLLNIAALHCFLSCISNFMLTSAALADYIPSPLLHSTFLPALSPILSKFLMHELSIISVLSSFVLVSCRTPFRCLYFLSLMNCIFSSGEHQDTSQEKFSELPSTRFPSNGAVLRVFSYSFSSLPLNSFLCYKKNK